MTVIAFPTIFTPATAEEHNDSLLANANTLKLSTTAWQAGGVTRTTFAVFANVLMLADVTTSILAQGGFLDFAASGSVTYTDPVSGDEVTAYVTPDPSDPAQNPTGELGTLDVLADSVYNVLRILSTFAGGAGAILNTSASTYGPFDAGGYHIAQPDATGSPSYSNTASLTIAPSATVGSVTDAVTSSGLIKLTVATHGLTTGDAVFVTDVGGVTAANGAWYVTVVNANTFTLDGSVFTGSYTSGGTVYTPTIANFIADSAGSDSDADDLNVVTQPVTSLVGVSVSNLEEWLGSDIESNVDLAARCRLKLQSLSPNGPAGAYEFFAKSAQTLAPTLTPPLAVSSAITRALVQANTATGTVTTTIANATGAPTSDDVAAVDAVLRAFCVPQGITSFVQAAAELNVTAVLELWVPTAYTTTAVAIAQVAVETYFRILQIGGVTDPSGPDPSTNVVPINAVLGSVFAALDANTVPIQDATLELNSDTINVQLALTPVPEVAVLSSLTVNVTPV